MTGWRVHAWVLMGNHYHLLIETPEPNLVAGMKWLQNTYTRRFNIRHRLWGRLFGDRYKAVPVERAAGDYYGSLIDYIHLNPVRARLVRAKAGQSVLDYPWSSVAGGYALLPSRRPRWLAAGDVLRAYGCADTVEGRRKCRVELPRPAEACWRWKTARRCGVPREASPGGRSPPKPRPARLVLGQPGLCRETARPRRKDPPQTAQPGIPWRPRAPRPRRARSPAAPGRRIAVPPPLKPGELAGLERQRSEEGLDRPRHPEPDNREPGLDRRAPGHVERRQRRPANPQQTRGEEHARSPERNWKTNVGHSVQKYYTP